MFHVNQLVGFWDAQSAATGIQFVGGATATKVGATSGTSTIALNSGLTGGIAAAAASGDFVIAAFSVGSGSDASLSITDGSSNYTLIGTELFISDTFCANLRVAYKFITADTTTTFGPTGDATRAGAMAVYVFRGVNVANPLDVTAATATGANSVYPNPPTITPSTSGSYVVCVGSNAHTRGVATFTSGDLTGFQTAGGDDTTDASVGIGHYVWTSGAFDAAAFGFSAADNTQFSWAAVTLALRPA